MQMRPARRFIAKAGWREIGGRRIYFRSKMEANFARHLEWRKKAGIILEWEYEPETFYFEGLKRGKNNYKPDFRITNTDQTHIYFEVKGYMDARSKTLLNRMTKYHPGIILELIDKDRYREIARWAGIMTDGWE